MPAVPAPINRPYPLGAPRDPLKFIKKPIEKQTSQKSAQGSQKVAPAAQHVAQSSQNDAKMIIRTPRERSPEAAWLKNVKT